MLNCDIESATYVCITALFCVTFVRSFPVHHLICWQTKNDCLFSSANMHFFFENYCACLVQTCAYLIISSQLSLSHLKILAILQVTVGCCTMDVLKQLSSEEISRLPADGTQSDRLGRLATHILNQRRLERIQF